jgi:hypothetical protein
LAHGHWRHGGHLNGHASSAFTTTYAIPAAWANADRLAIRLQSPTTGYYSYNWFWNYTAP